MKKISSLLLVLVLVLSLAAPAFAAEVTVPTMEGHTFTAYQIFTGTQAESETALGDVQWGNGINADAFLAALKNEATAFNVTVTNEDGSTTTANIFANCATAADVAAAMATFADNSDAAKLIANLADAHKTGDGVKLEGTTNLADGYYLIVDTTELADDAHDAHNSALLQVTRDITIAVKYSVPSVEKKVQDKNDSTGETTGWQDSADYDIGDVIPFQLTGTLPSNYSDYESYKYVFHDTMSGLTYVDNSVKVVIDGNDVTEKFTTTYENGKLTVSCDNLKTISGITADSKIVVTYTATLNEDAVVGAGGNVNTVYVEYSNNPNKGGEGETGKTPDDKVVVFTLQLTVNKVDENNAPLTGATFALYKWDNTAEAEDKWVLLDSMEGTDLTTFVFSGLDDGKYKLVETKAPAGYNMALDVEFEITAEHDTESDEPKLISITSSNPVVSVDTTGEGEAAVITGGVSTTVINQSGATLPETGGMGTTLFYIVGGILVLAAVVLLVTKRRMNTAE